MANSQFVASIHKDHLPFVSLATDAELAQFVRAQICQANGEELPELTGMAKALFDAHMALVERLEESSRKKSEAGKRGGNPVLKQCEAELKRNEAVLNQCLSTDKAEVKPVTYSVTNSDTVTDTVVVVDSSVAREGAVNNNNGLDEFGIDPATSAEADFRKAVIACAQAGIEILGPQNEKAVDRLIGDYGLPWVLAAAERVSEKPTAKRHIGMLRAILASWKKNGDIDYPSGGSCAAKPRGQPVSTEKNYDEGF